MNFSVLLLHLPYSESQPIHWQLYGGSQQSNVQRIEAGRLNSIDQLTELGKLHSEALLIALIPGELVTLRTLDIGRKLNRTIEKSLPYRLEDELSDDVEELHFTVLSHSNDQVTLAVVAKEWMNRWLEWLQLAELSCHQMLPDFLALPYSAGACSLCKTGSQWLIRYDEFAGAVCDDSWVKQYLDSLEQADELKVIDYSPTRRSSHSLSVVDPTFIPTTANLLQGEYQSSAAEKRKPVSYFRSSVLALALLGSFSSYQYSLILQTEKETFQNQLEVKKLYSELYPKERLIRPVSQLRQKLDLLKKNQQQEDSFLATLNDLTPTLNRGKNFEVQSSSYNRQQSVLKLAVTADSISSLTDLRDKLTELHRTKLQSLESTERGSKGLFVVNK